jgi:ketosteroid isomerase-like protein
MSQANVEIVRQVYDAAARRDGATVASLYAPDVEWNDSGSPPGEVASGGVKHGFESLQEWFRGWHDTWEDIAYEYEELIDAGDQVVSVSTIRARGRTSGLDVEFRQCALFEIREGRIVRALWYRTREEALAAAGLPG